MAVRKDYRLIIAGLPDRCENYWATVREAIRNEVQTSRILLRAEFIPDDETEVYFKAADVLVLPYTHIYQSGVLLLGYSFGLPVLAAEVGSLKDDILEGKTGFVFRTQDPIDLAKAAESYFASDLFSNLDSRRLEIIKYGRERHSRDTVAQITLSLFTSLCNEPFHEAEVTLPSTNYT